MPDPPDDGLVLGPILRRIAGTRATIWVETAQRATVEVRAKSGASGAERTFRVHGRHYALVVVDGLTPGTVDEYQVFLDGEQAWPPLDYPYPPPAIRARADAARVRLVYGSGRQASPRVTHRHPPDALDAYAVRLAAEWKAGEPKAWPDSLVLLGDQVYADETSPVI